MNLLTPQILTDIRNHALNDKPSECCGLIIKNDNDYKSIACKNIAYIKTGMAILDSFDYICASNLGDIVGHYHSQPKDPPSLLDNFTANNHNIHSIVYTWETNKFYIIEPKLKNYLDKNFKIPESDCVTLVVDYYKIEKNINVTDYRMTNRGFRYVSDNLILESFKKQGFYEVNRDDIRKDDVLLCSSCVGSENKNGNISHIGIYLENDLILHHPLNMKSCIEYMTPKFKKTIILAMRHKKDE